MTSPARLVLRCDGNSQIGLGHVVRSLALAEIVRPLFAQVRLLIQNPSAAVQELALEAQATVLPLAAQSPADELIEVCAWLRPTDVLVLDGYHFDAAYQTTVQATGCKLVLIDDLRQSPGRADLLINHGPGVQASDYPAGSNTRFCLGPAFSLLRKPFREQARPPRPAPATIASVLLCFGGADPLRLTQRVLAALLQLASIRTVGVVTGSSFTATAELRELAATQSQKQVDFHHNVSAGALVALLRQHEVAVVPASTVLLEALLLGGAAITGYYADNQNFLANYVHNHEQAFSVGNFAALTDTALRQGLLAGLRFHQTTRRQPYVPALRPDRLRAEFQQLLA